MAYVVQSKNMDKPRKTPDGSEDLKKNIQNVASVGKMGINIVSGVDKLRESNLKRMGTLAHQWEVAGKDGGASRLVDMFVSDPSVRNVEGKSLIPKPLRRYMKGVMTESLDRVMLNPRILEGVSEFEKEGLYNKLHASLEGHKYTEEQINNLLSEFDPSSFPQPYVDSSASFNKSLDNIHNLPPIAGKDVEFGNYNKYGVNLPETSIPDYGPGGRVSPRRVNVPLEKSGGNLQTELMPPGHVRPRVGIDSKYAFDKALKRDTTWSQSLGHTVVHEGVEYNVMPDGSLLHKGVEMQHDWLNIPDEAAEVGFSGVRPNMYKHPRLGNKYKYRMGRDKPFTTRTFGQDYKGITPIENTVIGVDNTISPDNLRVNQSLRKQFLEQKNTIQDPLQMQPVNINAKSSTTSALDRDWWNDPVPTPKGGPMMASAGDSDVYLDEKYGGITGQVIGKTTEKLANAQVASALNAGSKNVADVVSTISKGKDIAKFAGKAGQVAGQIGGVVRAGKALSDGLQAEDIPEIAKGTVGVATPWLVAAGPAGWSVLGAAALHDLYEMWDAS